MIWGYPYVRKNAYSIMGFDPSHILKLISVGHEIPAFFGSYWVEHQITESEFGLVEVWVWFHDNDEPLS